MLALFVLVNLLLCRVIASKSTEEEATNEDFGTNLIATMRNDANLDLPVDEEYEDLRAELLAYHTALASLSSNSKRRSMMSTSCWNLGGICVDYKLCTGFRFLTEVPGCKDKLNVCCFAWNHFKVKDWRHEGIQTLALPWSEHTEFGGLGVVDKPKSEKKKKKNKNVNKHKEKNSVQEHNVENNEDNVDEDDNKDRVVDSNLDNKSSETKTVGFIIKRQ